MLHLVYITTSFKPGAIPNIFSEILPYIIKYYKVSIIVFEEEPDIYSEYSMIKNLGINFYFLKCKKWQICKTYITLRRCIKSIQPDIIHSHLGRADIISTLANWKKIPHIGTFHSVRKNFSPVTLLMFKIIDPLIDIRTGVSQTVIDDFYISFFLKSLHRVIYNPVSANRLKILHTVDELRTIFSIPKDAKIIACIGRLVPAKGHRYLLHAFAEIYNEIKTAYLIIAGDGPLYSELQDLAITLNIIDRVKFIGFYTPPSDIINLAQLVVFPSLWEGMGLVPLEALLLSRPIIASDLPVLRECIPDGEGVYFVEPGNSKALAKAIKIMIQKLDYEAYFKHVIPIITNKYHAKTIADQYTEIYNLYNRKGAKTTL